MAKGQQRSNKEVRKPKKPKGPAKPETTFGSQVKLAGNVNDLRPPKGKG